MQETPQPVPQDTAFLYNQYISMLTPDLTGTVMVEKDDETITEILRQRTELRNRILSASLPFPQREAAFRAYVALIDQVAHGPTLDEYRDSHETSYGSISFRIITGFGYLLSEMGNLPGEDRIQFRALIRQMEPEMRYFYMAALEIVDVEEFSKKLYLYTDDEFNEKRVANRQKVENALEELAGDLNTQIVEALFKLLTEDLFAEIAGGLRTDGLQIKLRKRSGSAPTEILRDMDQWCHQANSLIASKSSNREYLLALSELVVRIIEIHPFADWNGTITMYLALYISKQRFPDKKIVFIKDNLKMFSYIFNGNLIIIRHLLKELNRRELLSDSSSRKAVESFVRAKIPSAIRQTFIGDQLAGAAANLVLGAENSNSKK